jgi:hypothetical protein
VIPPVQEYRIGYYSFISANLAGARGGRKAKATENAPLFSVALASSKTTTEKANII